MTHATVQLAVLNSMLGADITASVKRQRELGLVQLDLKDELFGREVLGLTLDQARSVRSLADEHGMTVYCLSTHLFGDIVERGEEGFRREHLSQVEWAVRLAQILRPRLVRLLACQSHSDRTDQPAGEFLLRHAPWVLDLYRQAVAALRSAGVGVVIENEVADCVLATPDDVLSFFDVLDSGAGFTWDVQNMWALGTPPSLGVYQQLRPLIQYVHLKGGRAGPDGTLRWRSSLRDATWAVREIVLTVAADGVSPVVCLNPSHGEPPPGYQEPAIVEDDIHFVQEIVAGAAR